MYCDLGAKWLGPINPRNQSVPAGMQGIRFCGHKRDASWEESWHEIYAGKLTQKYSKNDKERWWHTNWLDW